MFNHKKKLIVVAVAGALGASLSGAVFAQEEGEGGGGSKVGGVNIYGRLYPEFTVMSGSGATAATSTTANGGLSTLAKTATGLNAKSRNSVDASNSRLGFKGTEDLGGGMSAIWQIESTIPLDQGGGSFATRESFVGLKGAFGTVRLGFMDTVYKDLGDPIRFMGLSSGNNMSNSDVLSAKTPFGDGKTGSFHLRQPNGLWYQTPNMGGATGYVQYSPDTKESLAAGASSNREFWSMGLKYNVGPWSLRLAHEIHKDFFGASGSLTAAALKNDTNPNAHSNDTATRGTIYYNSKGSKASLDLSQIRYEETGATAAGKFKDYKNFRWAVSLEQQWTGPWRTGLSYSNSANGSCSLYGNVSCSTAGLSGNHLTLGGEYQFSKRTSVFASWTKLTNGSSASFTDSENLKSYETGMDGRLVSVGIRHDF